MELLSVAILIWIEASIASADEWNYGHPSKWKGTCKTGTQQSPIDLATSATVEQIFSPFNFTNYDIANNASVTNNGHSVAIRLEARLLPRVSGGGLIGKYVLDHLHFHWESEHTVDAYRYPLEMHLVHYSAKYTNLSEAVQHSGGVAVLGVLFELSIDDDEGFVPLTKIIERVVRFPKSKAGLGTSISAKNFLPRSTADYYRYRGSLTTPGCNEGVIWTVFAHTLPISADQVNHFEAVWLTDGPLTLNYRAVQPLNGREILLRSSKGKKTLRSTGIRASTTTILLFVMIFFTKNTHS